MTAAENVPADPSRGSGPAGDDVPPPVRSTTRTDRGSGHPLITWGEVAWSIVLIAASAAFCIAAVLHTR